MKYYVIDIESYNNGDKSSKAIYEYDTFDGALAVYHSRIGSAIKNEACETVLCMLVGEKGSQHEEFYWERH